MAKSKTISKLSILLGLSAAELEKDLSSAANKLNRFDKKAQSAGSGLKSFDDIRARASRGVASFAGRLKSAAVNIALFVTAAIAAQASLGGLTAAFDRIDAVAKTADKLGTTTEELTAFQYAAELSGVKADQAAVALQRMTRRIADAAMGGGEAKAALEELGLSASELKDLSPTEAFARISDAFQDVESQSDRVRLAFKLFDSEGVALVNTLKIGSEGLAELAEEAKRLGFTFDREAAAKVEAANDAMANMSRAAEGLGNTLAISLSPAVTSLANGLADFVASLQSVDSNTVRTITTIAAFSAAFLAMISIVPRIITGVRAVILTLRALTTASIITSGATGTLPVVLGSLAVAAGAAYGTTLLFDRMTESAGAAAKSAGKLGDASEALGDKLAESNDKIAESAKAAQAEMQKWEGIGSRIEASTRTPFETMRASIREANEALRRGTIDAVTFNRAVAKASDAFVAAEMRTDRIRRPSSVTNFVGAARRGTSAGNDAVAQAINAREKQIDKLRELASEAKRRAKLLESVRLAINATTLAVKSSTIVVHKHKI